MSTLVRLTLAEYDRMIAQGVFDETRDRRIELICGELRETCPPGPAHEDVIDVLNRWSVLNTSPDEIRVRIQNSIGIPELDSAPQPDVAWVREKSYRRGRPLPKDVLLLIEVSDSTLADDRGEKAGLYASAGIRDYWIVNIPEQCVEVFRNPRRGRYHQATRYTAGQTVCPLRKPDVELSVSSLFAG